MQKRKYGYILLTLLVVSGLAGTPSGNTLSKKERKYVADHMKDTRADVLKSVKDLSEAQLNFRPGQDQWTVKECIYHIAISENNLWNMIEATMKAPANPEKRSEIKMTDEQLVKMLQDRSFKVKTVEQFEPKNTPYKSLDEALTNFKINRASHIKYVKSTTEDLRNHVVQMPFGWLDCYQVCLMISAHSNRHTQQINEVKKTAGFP
jgi:DinB family protein